MRLKTLLKEKNITQNQLANALGVTQSLISQWISGMCEPRIEMLIKMAEFLNTPLTELAECFNNA